MGLFNVSPALLFLQMLTSRKVIANILLKPKARPQMTFDAAAISGKLEDGIFSRAEYKISIG